MIIIMMMMMMMMLEYSSFFHRLLRFRPGILDHQPTPGRPAY